MAYLELVLISHFFSTAETSEESIDPPKTTVATVPSTECKYNNEFEFYVCVHNILVFLK